MLYFQLSRHPAETINLFIRHVGRFCETAEVISDELHVGRGAFDVYLAPLNKLIIIIIIMYTRPAMRTQRCILSYFYAHVVCCYVLQRCPTRGVHICFVI